MPIIKHKHDTGFTIIPNALLRDKNLSMRDVGILCSMLSLPDEWDFSVAGLCEFFPNDGKTAITSSLKAIESAGYLRRTWIRDSKGRIIECIWEISDRPDLFDECSECENPCSDFEDTESRDTGNRPQIKKRYKKEKNKERKERVASLQHAAVCKTVRPSAQEVRDYVKSEGITGVDPDYFVDYYDTNGWTQGRSRKPILDWRACVRTWRRYDRAVSPKPPEEREYDAFSDLELFINEEGLPQWRMKQ